MVEFLDLAAASKAAETFIADTGGLPEISQASTGLHAAINQTREEIAGAAFASRFLNPASDNFKAMVGSYKLTPMAREMIDQEGEAGAKRAQLTTELETIENELFLLIQRLVELRCDLVVSQTEM